MRGAREPSTGSVETHSPTSADALEALLRRCAGGDRTALREIYDREAPRLVGVACGIARDRTVGEDIVHDALVKVWTRAATFDPARGDARTWIVAIARNQALDQVRGERRESASNEVNEAADAVPPSPELWERVSRTLGGGTIPRSPAAPSAKSMTRVPLTRRLGFWRAATGLVAIAAILLAAVVLLRPFDPPAAYMAILQSRDGADAGYLARADADGNMTLTALETVSIAPDRTLQLWTLADPAAGPVSLGLLEPGQSMMVPAAALPALGGGQLFQISVESEAGSPTGSPTGPVLYIGRTVDTSNY
ncbi:anti-sigma factor [Inquilinus sp. CAU 1745]|uniref:anti-sigma factor domain-containing protein n=1 Tax=Inquilinus sp. CAU 1745 TaxID=3140369 RepID=UPI00325BB9BF